MKRFGMILALVFVLLAPVAPAAAWAQLPPNCSSLLLVKEGQLMKLVYMNSMTDQTAEMTARFKRFGWREPRKGECIPERHDIGVAIQPAEVRFIYTFVKDGRIIPAEDALDTNNPFWRVADTVMYYADKHRAPSLLHPPKP
jgi:hypothetical protein